MDTNKEFINQSLKGGIFAFVLSAISVLLLALVAKIFTLSSSSLPIINQVLKAIAVLVGTWTCVSGNKRLYKALLVAVVFAVLNLILFVILGGQFTWGQILLDLLISVAVAALTSIFLSRKSV